MKLPLDGAVSLHLDNESSREVEQGISMMRPSKSSHVQKTCINFYDDDSVLTGIFQISFLFDGCPICY